MVKDLTVGIDPDPNGFHAYVIVETATKEIQDILQLDWKQWLVGAGDRVEACVIEWPGMGQSFACPSQKLPDGTTRNPINDTIRMAVLLAYELHNRGVPTYIPHRQRLLASAGRKVSDKGNTDLWWKRQIGELYDVSKRENGNFIWKGTGLGQTHTQSALLCARFPWCDFDGTTQDIRNPKKMLPDLRYKGSFR